jgi:hypothetical protein
MMRASCNIQTQRPDGCEWVASHVCENEDARFDQKFAEDIHQCYIEAWRDLVAASDDEPGDEPEQTWRMYVERQGVDVLIDFCPFCGAKLRQP